MNHDYPTDRLANGQFAPGNRGGPGGARSGRTMALRVLDDLLAETGSQDRLREALRAELDKNPVRFFRQLIMPLLPRNVDLNVEAGGAVSWLRIKDAFADTDADQTTPTA